MVNSGRVQRGTGLLVAAPAFVAVILAAGFGGTVAAYEIGDPGAVMRWLVPLSGTLSVVGACGAVGYLLVGAFLTPETTRTHRRETWASGSGSPD